MRSGHTQFSKVANSQMLLSFCLGGQISGKQRSQGAAGLKNHTELAVGLQEYSQCGFHSLVDSHMPETEPHFAGLTF